MNTKKRILVLALLVGLALALTATAVFALDLIETSTKTTGATTITWDSSFADFNYILGDTITMTVTWTVDAGAASYDSFGLRCNGPNPLALPGKGFTAAVQAVGGKGRGCPNFTPKSKKDPADGELISVSQSGNSVTVEFKFTDLHFDKKRNVDLGNAHFKLYLLVDVDGDGTPETRAGYGVNVHVEDPQ